MKKRICLLIMILIFPTLALADSGGPTIIGYDAIISNKNGSKAKGYDDSKKTKTFAYNTKVHVHDEFDDSLEICALPFRSGETSCNYDDIWYISPKDVVPILEEVNPKDIKNSIFESKRKFIVFDKNGLSLKKGPADAYTRYDEVIPYKTTLESKYCDGNYYCYINDGTYKGWISTGDKVAIEELYEKTLNAVEVNVYDDEDNIIGTIPSEANLDRIYYLSLNDKYHFYVEYQNIAGLVKNLYYGFNETGKLLALQNTRITSIDGKVRTDVATGAEMDILFMQDYNEGIETDKDDSYYYVEYKKIKGFINSKDVVEKYESDKEENYILEKDAEMYSYPSFNANKTNKIIPKDTEITSLYIYYDYDDELGSTYWSLVKFENVTGWVLNNQVQDDGTIKNNHKPQTTTPIKQEPILNSTSKPSSKSIILYSIIGALLIGLTAAVSIIFINKQLKNDAKVKEEKKKEIEKQLEETKTNLKKIQLEDLKIKEKEDDKEIKKPKQ